MKVTCKITFIDGETIKVTDENFVINGWLIDEEGKNSNPREYYLSSHYMTSGNHYAFETVEPIVGIAGFIGSVDFFSIGYDTEVLKIYKSTSVKSVDNLHLNKQRPKIYRNKPKGL